MMKILEWWDDRCRSLCKTSKTWNLINEESSHPIQSRLISLFSFFIPPFFFLFHFLCSDLILLYWPQLNDVEWLKKKPNTIRYKHMPPTDFYKRRKLMHDFLFWIYDGFIIPLLRNNFYITETSPHKSRVFYYRR